MNNKDIRDSFDLNQNETKKKSEESKQAKPNKLKKRKITPVKQVRGKVNKNCLPIALIQTPFDPEYAEYQQMTVEQKVRFARQYYKDYEEEMARLRKKEAALQNKRKVGKRDRVYSGGRTGRSINLIARRVGMKPSNFRYAELIVLFADELRRLGKKKEANHLLSILNHRSINAARIERDRLLKEAEEERDRKEAADNKRILDALRRKPEV